MEKSIYTLSIIIPVFNEEKTITTILDRVLAVDLIGGVKKQLIIVNDFSLDSTEALIKTYLSTHPQVNIIYSCHDFNRGKGAAIRTGIELATGEFIIVQDADLEYDPREYNLLLQPILEGFADVVYGSRFLGSKPHRILFFWHSFGNKLLTFISNMFTNLNLTDMETCYKMFKSTFIKGLKIKENRFGFEPEITARISRIKGIRIYEVGISYYGRTYADGKKINWKDGLRAIYCIVKYNIICRK